MISKTNGEIQDKGQMCVSICHEIISKLESRSVMDNDQNLMKVSAKLKKITLGDGIGESVKTGNVPKDNGARYEMKVLREMFINEQIGKPVWTCGLCNDAVDDGHVCAMHRPEV